MAAPLTLFHGTLVCRGTLVENHWTGQMKHLWTFLLLSIKNKDFPFLNKSDGVTKYNSIFFCVSEFPLRDAKDKIVLFSVRLDCLEIKNENIFGL